MNDATNTATLSLGDTVAGEYYEVPFVGVVTSFDSSGYVYVRPIERLVVVGLERGEIALDPWQRKSLRLVRRGEITAADVRAAPAHVLGGEYLTSEAIARLVAVAS